VLVTHDSDFLRLHQQQPHSGIAYCAQGTRTIGQIVTSLVLIHEILAPAEMAGRIEFIWIGFRRSWALMTLDAPGACRDCRVPIAGAGPKATRATEARSNERRRTSR
jgi:hypothetical protein